MHRKQTTKDKLALAIGVKSPIEREVLEQLSGFGIKNVLEQHYEPFRFYFVRTRKCPYTPDFVLPNGIIIEVKGWFQSIERTKFLAIREQYPGFDIRFLFQNAKNKISKNSSTTYAMWCDKHGFKWAHKKVPIEWVQESKDERRIEALRAIGYELEK